MARMTLERFGKQISEALGSHLVTLLVYGSAAREPGAERQGPEKVNTLLIVDRADAEVFGRLAGPVREWLKARHPPPLMMTEREWRESADAFPIEYDDIRAHHRTLAGRNPWDGIQVKREHVRRQLEHELKGKLMHLRQAYIADWNNPGRLAAVVQGTWAGFLTMLRAVLRLAGRDVPASSEALVSTAAALLGFSADRLSEPEAYLDAVTRTAQYVDRMERNPS